MVAADEGVKPQTREHLAVCSLLGIPAALVALTKVDLVSSDLLELAQLEVEELLAPTPFAGAAILPVSSTTGQGIPELKAALLDLAAKYAMPEEPDRPARLPVDRAFHLKGLGVVVTGTLGSGAMRAGGHAGDPARRGRSGCGCAASRCTASRARRRRPASGPPSSSPASPWRISRRGLQLGAPEAFAATTSLLARFTLLPDAPAPVRGFVPVRLHLYASEVLGRMRPLNPEGLGAGGDRPGRDPPAGAGFGIARGPLHPPPPLAARDARRRRDSRSALAAAPRHHPRSRRWPRSRRTSTPPSPSGCRRRESAGSRRPSWRADWECRRPRSPSGWRRSPATRS